MGRPKTTDAKARADDWISFRVRPDFISMLNQLCGQLNPGGPGVSRGEAIRAAVSMAVKNHPKTALQLDEDDLAAGSALLTVTKPKGPIVVRVQLSRRLQGLVKELLDAATRLAGAA